MPRIEAGSVFPDKFGLLSSQFPKLILITALLLSGIIQGGFLILLLLRKASNPVPNRILSALIMVLICHLALICLDVKNLFIIYPHFSKLSWLLPLLYGPLILLLTQGIVSPGFRFTKTQLIYFAPFLIYLIILLPYFLLSGVEKVAYLSDAELVQASDFGWMNSLTNFLHMSFTVGALIWFYRYVPQRSEHFSNVALVNIPWLKEFLWIILSVMLLSVITFYSRKYEVSYLKSVYPAHFVLVVALVYWIAYKLLQEKNELAPSPEIHTPTAELEAVKYAKSGLTDDASQTIATRLTDLMRTQRPYLDSDVTIVDLSAMLNVPRHQLSQVINTEFGSNFYEFVNQYRLSEFKKQVLAPANAHLSILGVALECGFNSKATFNQVFKKAEGMTPSQFVKSAGAET